MALAQECWQHSRAWATRELLTILSVVMPGLVLAAPTSAPPPAVTVAPVRVSDVAPVYTFIGHIQAIQTVQLIARVTAFLEAIEFEEGAEVSKGQVLFELQKAPFKAAVQAAKAQLDKAQANYVQAQAAFERASKLNQHGFEAQSNLEQARAARDTAAADVEAAKANLAQAAINLSYCTIVAPISGRIGAATYTVGNLVTPSSQPLATINQMDPIRVVFSVTDRQLISVRQRTESSVEQIADRLTVSLQLANGSDYEHQGKITFVGNQVDPQTGTVPVRATFPNTDRLLLPGAFATVEVRAANPRERPLAPVAAVQSDRQGNYVLVVGPDNKVQQQRVTLGRQIAQNVIIDGGLTGGEQVIVQGVQKVQPGQVVTPHTAAPPAQAASAGG